MFSTTWTDQTAQTDRQTGIPTDGQTGKPTARQNRRIELAGVETVGQFADKKQAG